MSTTAATSPGSGRSSSACAWLGAWWRGRITHAVVPDTRAARKLRTLRPAAWTDEQWEAWLEEHMVMEAPS